MQRQMSCKDTGVITAQLVHVQWNTSVSKE